MPDYNFYYEVGKLYQREPSLIPAPALYDFDAEKIYAAVLDRLAQPLPDGSESPFSSKTPGSASSILVSNLVFIQSAIAHEFDLVPDVMFLNWLRSAGTYIRQAEFPVIKMRFSRTLEAVANNIPVLIPAGTEVQSIFNPGMIAYTVEDLEITSGESAFVPARLNQLGTLNQVREGEFVSVPRLLSFVDSARNEGIVSDGRNPESLTEAVLRMRDWFLTGERAATDRDFGYWAMQAGATKVNVIRGKTPGYEGVARDLRTIAVYPATLEQIVRADLLDRKLADERLQVVGAQIIPVTGEISIKATSDLSAVKALALAQTAIADQINPPGGVWGDEEFGKTIGGVMEKIVGIYATASVDLQHDETGENLADLKIEPWQLIEVQNSIRILIER